MTGSLLQVYLHIGAMKTGTSYLQQLLVENKRRLSADGVLFPGRPGWGEQVRGVRDMLRLAADDEMRVSMAGAWQRLQEEIRGHDGRAALLSMEFMSFAREPRARALVESLAPADVHVVLTVRDAGRVLPAQWQESTQNRKTSSWQEYTDAVLQGTNADNPIWRTSMRALNIPRMLDVWGPLVPADRLHVVLVPPPGAPSTLLWERFATAVGIEAARYDPPRRRRNESLGYVSADLMRRANVELQKLPLSDYQRTVKSYLCKQVLSARTGEPKMTMTTALADFAQHWNSTMTDAVRASGAQLCGDLSDLAVDPPGSATAVDPPPQDALLDAASDAVVGLEQLIEFRRLRLESGDDDTEQFSPTLGPSRSQLRAGWEAARNPVGDAVSAVVAASREAVELRQRRRSLDGRDDAAAAALRRATRLGRAALGRLRR